MKTFELDSTLKPTVPDAYTYSDSKRSMVGVTIQPQVPKPRKAGEINMTIVSTPIGGSKKSYREEQAERLSAQYPPDGFVYHQGYLRYLEICWRDHLSAVISPDIIWHMVLCELAFVVKQSPNQFAELFTTTPEKKQIILVHTKEVDRIDVDAIVATLKRCVPTDVDLFLPRFTTSTPMSQLAFHVAFADMVSPYHSYGTFMCGIPAIRVIGEESDWSSIYGRLDKLKRPFAGHTTITSYLDRCMNRVAFMMNGDADFWKGMVSLKRCGSGSQHEMSGWIMDFVMCVKPGTQIEGLPTHLSKMDWVNITTKQKFRLNAGVLRSQYQDGFLVPEFHAGSWEITQEIGEMIGANDARLAAEEAEIKQLIARSRERREKMNASFTPEGKVKGWQPE